MTLSVIPYIDIHTHSSANKANVCSILSISPEVQINPISTAMYSVGIHPWKISSCDLSKTYKNLETAALRSDVLAIGEIGLDRLTETPLSFQKEVFQKQLQIAEKHKKPVIIHCVKCFSELINIRKKSNSKLPWIIHAFSKNEHIAQELLNSGCYLSFGKALLKNEKLQELFQKLLINQIFIETDDSDVTIEEMYEKAAELKAMGVEDFKKVLNTNFKNCFKRV